MAKKDNIFKEKIKKVPQFSFNKDVSDAFDDMAERSIPCYKDMQRIIARFSLEYYKKDSFIYDLGTSTGNTVIEIFKEFNRVDKVTPKIVCIDKSIHMIEIAKKKCFEQGINWVCDSAENVMFKNSSVVIASFILQFIKHIEKKKIIKRVYNDLRKNGIFILCEKIISDDKRIEKYTKNLYYTFKKNKGYSELEIEQKEIALKNVLNLYTVEKYIELLKNTGFSKIDIVIKYLNFVCMVAVK